MVFIIYWLYYIFAARDPDVWISDIRAALQSANTAKAPGICSIVQYFKSWVTDQNTNYK